MATLEQEFQAQKAWIAGCEDVDALMDRIADLRDDVRVAIREGRTLLRMRAGDLVELAENRVIGLKARALRASTTKRRAPPSDGRELGDARRKADEQAARDDHERERRERRQREREAGERRAREERERQANARREAEQRDREQRDAARRLDEEERAAATRLANARAAETEARAAVLRAQAEAARTKPAAPPPATTPSLRTVVAQEPDRSSRPVPAPSSKVLPRQRAPVPVPAPAPATGDRASGSDLKRAMAGSNEPDHPAQPADSEISEADRLALASVGRWPPMGPDRRSQFWSRDQDWPAEWTLTGFDLAQFRGRVNVTRGVLAAQLGMTPAIVANAEARPREKVGPALQIALRRAMDVVEAEARRRREPAVPQEAKTPTPEPPTPVTAEGTSMLPAAATPAESPLTGADLVRLRSERGLSQRQMAELLGMGHGMVAKAEVAAAKVLGEQMQVAVTKVLRQAG